MKKIAVKIILIIFGSALAGIGLNLFLIPNNITPGGLSGLAMLISTISGGILPVGILTLVLNLPLFIIGYKVLGKNFTINSVLGTVAFSVFIDLMSFVDRYRDILLNMSNYGGEVDYILCAIFGGLLLGGGLGIIFRSGATTGGTDIVARLVQRKASWMTIGQLVLTLDACFLIVVFVTYRSIIATLYTAIAIFVSSKVIDIVEEGVNYAKEIYIFTENPVDISRDILTDLQRGATLVKGTGMYTGSEVLILICVVHNRQIQALRTIVTRYDPKAFVVVKDVRTVHGLW